MPEQDQTTGADWSEDTPAAGQPAPAPVLEEPAKPALLPDPVASLRQVFRDVAAIIGEDKAAFVLAEFYGVANPDVLRAADLLDAIDKLYEAA